MKNYSRPTKEALSEHGWCFHRQGRGDHEIWIDPKSGKKVSVDNQMKSRHSANGVLKAAGIGKKF